MGTFISFRNIERKYLLLNIYFLITAFIFEVIKYFFRKKSNNKELNIYMPVFSNCLVYFEFCLLIIPEFIIKKFCSSKSNKSFNLKNKYKIKDIAIIGLISLITLINQFSEILSNIFRIKSNDRISTEYFLIFVFLAVFIITNLVLKNIYYKHQYISIIIIILLGIIKNIFKFLQNHTEEFNIEIKNMIIMFFLNIIDIISLGFYLSYSKILLDKYYFSPYQLCYLFGFINASIFLIVSIILSFIPCKNSLCLMKYNNENYIDNYKYFFSNLNSNQRIRFLIESLYHPLSFFIINLLNKIFLLLFYNNINQL